MEPTSYCPDRQQGEPVPEYAMRVLRYALTLGLEPLTISQLEAADMAAMLTVCALPGTALSPDAARLANTLHDLRLRLAVRLQTKRQQLVALGKMLADANLADDSPLDAASPTPATETDADRAARLLRAALTLIMQPGTGQSDGNGNGGQHARLVPPTPRLPPSGTALRVPVSDDGGF